MKLRDIGAEVKVVNGRKPNTSISATVVGYALIQGLSGWLSGYVVRLSESCDTPSGFYLRTIAVTEGDLEP